MIGDSSSGFLSEFCSNFFFNAGKTSRHIFSGLQHLSLAGDDDVHFHKTLMKMRNNGLKCKKMKNYCTVLLKLAEKFSLAASQPKALASLSADHFLVRLMVAEFCYHSLKKPLALTNCLNQRIFKSLQKLILTAFTDRND